MATSSRVGLVLLVVAVVLALAAIAARTWLWPGGDVPGSHVSDERLRELRERIERETDAADAVVMAYQPGVNGRIDDMAVSAVDILRGLPGVAEVERLVAPQKPTRRIVHIRDLHFVPRDLFALDISQSAGRPLTDAEVEKLYEAHLLETELIQVEQLVLLRCLASHHGLRKVRIEGLTAGEVKLFHDKITALKSLEKETAAARRQLREVRKLMTEMDPGTDRHRQAAGIERELTDLLDRHRPELLNVGAAGRLLMAGGIDAVLALDDEKMLDLAKPLTPDGRIRFDAAKVREREDAMVRITISDGPFALVVLGGNHDLSDSVRRVAGDSCEYVRVTTRAYREFGGR